MFNGALPSRIRPSKFQRCRVVPSAVLDMVPIRQSGLVGSMAVIVMGCEPTLIRLTGSIRMPIGLAPWFALPVYVRAGEPLGKNHFGSFSEPWISTRPMRPEPLPQGRQANDVPPRSRWRGVEPVKSHRRHPWPAYRMQPDPAPR